MLDIQAGTVLGAEDRVDRAVLRLGALIGGTSLTLALAIGRVVIEELYSGDLSRWRLRGPKDHSLRRLATDPRLTISASALYRAIGIYELKVRLPDHPLWEQLTICHLRAVLGLPEDEQTQLLERATNESWSIPMLEQAAGKTRAQHKSSRGGRPRKPRFARSIEFAEKALSDDEAAFGDLDALEEMSAEQRAELTQRLQFVRRRCAELARLLDANH
ncbi:MAG: hypothetical protein HC927_03400 [Deltaproteobacteria bacterium]|nr:hypothetical protein [Deltaproteobacteria bacterium]